MASKYFFNFLYRIIYRIKQKLMILTKNYLFLIYIPYNIPYSIPYKIKIGNF